jgi:hypothetical protein
MVTLVTVFILLYGKHCGSAYHVSFKIQEVFVSNLRAETKFRSCKCPINIVSSQGIKENIVEDEIMFLDRSLCILCK